MNLDSVQNAKCESFRHLFQFQETPSAFGANDPYPVFAPTRESPAFAEIFQQSDPGGDPRTMIALGVYRPSGSSHRSREDLRLGVFVQRKKLERHPLVEEIVRLSKGECKIVYTGPIGRRAHESVPISRPLRIGSSIGHHRISAGTLGAFAVNRNGGGVGILSNNHVLADTNRGRPRDLILQPGRGDGGDRKNPAHHVAYLHKFVPLSFEPGSVNYVDCAFAYIMDGIGRETSNLIDPSDGNASWGVRAEDDPLMEGDYVKKIGRTTGLTYGIVEATQVDNLFVNMVFGDPRRRARFDRQISIAGVESMFSRNGDSGSLIWTERNAPAALLFAGAEKGDAPGGTTFANPIAQVCDTLDIDLYFGP